VGIKRGTVGIKKAPASGKCPENKGLAPWENESYGGNRGYIINSLLTPSIINSLLTPSIINSRKTEKDTWDHLTTDDESPIN